jgi:hypothetical protein
VNLVRIQVPAFGLLGLHTLRLRRNYQRVESERAVEARQARSQDGA